MFGRVYIVAYVNLVNLLLVSLLAVPTVDAQTYRPLKIVRPVGTGAAGTGLHASNRIYRAYPGIEYNIHADAIGGRWPYTYSLSNAPSGMTIVPGPCTTIGPSCTAGTISWTPPSTGTYGPITVTIRDADNNEVSGTWSITVSTTIGSNGFCFIDAVNGDDSTGNGSLATPFRTLVGAHSGCGSRSILYFRAGTYTISQSIEVPGYSGNARRVDWPETTRGGIWLAYPGETPIIDFESDGTPGRPFFNMQGENLWFDGLTLRNIGNHAFRLLNRVDLYGAVIRNITATNLMSGADGDNSSFFMWTTCSDCTSYYDTVQNSSFSDVLSDACALKVYAVRDGIFETSSFSNSLLTTEAILALKGGTLPDETVRANILVGSINTGIGGNMSYFSGEIYHNLAIQSTTPDDRNGTLTLGVAMVNPLGPVQVYRNTFVGRVNVSNLTTASGPYTFTHNVIVNSGGTGGSCPQRIACFSVTAYDRIVMVDNLQGAPSDGIVDSNGQLAGDYRTTWLGLRGYELAETNQARTRGYGGFRAIGGASIR